jgi:uroporphyrinogen decarboxylase
MKGNRARLTSRERVQLALRREPADRIPRAESFWPETIPLWRSQGLSADTDLAALFGYDIAGAGWVDHQARPGFTEILEETPEWIVRRDGNGAILRFWKHKSGTPEHVRFTVESEETWRALKKELLAAPVERRINTEGALRAMRAARAADRWFCWASVECFEVAKDVVGHEILCCAMAENPERARDIFDTETQVALRALDHLERTGVQFDGAWIYGDIAFNHGPFCSPRMYRELVMPAHARLVGWFKARGLPVIYHTDGDFRPLIPAMLEIGIDCFQPLEAKAGVDVRELKPQYGDRVALMGNIDIMTLITNDPERIEAEVAAKIPIAMRGGGYIYHSDHSIPPGVTWQSYQFLMDRVEQYGRW